MVQTIAFDAASNSSQNSAASPFTWNHTCTGSNLMLVLMFRLDTGHGITSVTYNSVAMTLIDSQTFNSRILYTYVLPNPATGSNAISIAFDTGSASASAAAASYTGVKQSTTLDNHGTFTATASSTYAESVTSVADKCWHITGVANDNASVVSQAGTGTTVRAHNEAVFNIAIADNNGAITPAGSNTLNFTASVGSPAWASNGLTLQPQPDITTLTATAGSYSMTGNSSILHRIITMVVTAGSYTYTGVSVAFSTVIKFIPGTKHSTAFSDSSKSSSAWTDSSKNSSSFTNSTKN